MLGLQGKVNEAIVFPKCVQLRIGQLALIYAKQRSGDTRGNGNQSEQLPRSGGRNIAEARDGGR
jgi:hypothetical protein